MRATYKFLFLTAWLCLASNCFPAPGFKVIRDTNGVAWLQKPDGDRLWSFGVCVVDTGVRFEDYDPTNPAYAAWHYYPSKPAWTAGALQTLVNGGFNTVGAWSDYSSLLSSPGNNLYMTPILHAGSSAGFPWLDMWDPALVKVADDVTKGLIEGLKNDPRIIGYFSDNELGWWKPAVWDWIWKQKTLYEREHVVSFLQKRYKSDWRSFTADFDVEGASSWADLAKRGHPYLRADAKGIGAIGAVLGLLADRYYSLCSSFVKKYAPDALYLGDRYISNYYPEVAQAGGRYCDVVSTNLNPDFKDGNFARFFLYGLEQLARKPLMITEYYMTSKAGRSGNGNDRSGFPVVDTLQERADGFARTTQALLGNPDVVGAHWFQYYDEPKNGRGDGENYNFGLVDTSNKPYEELLAKGKALDLAALHARASVGYEADQGSFPASAVGGDPLETLNRTAGFVPAVQDIARGDLYSWPAGDSVQLAMIWPEERFTENYFRGGKVPPSCLTSVTISIPGTNKTRTFVPSVLPSSFENGWFSKATVGTTSDFGFRSRPRGSVGRFNQAK